MEIARAERRFKATAQDDPTGSYAVLYSYFGDGSRYTCSVGDVPIS